MTPCIDGMTSPLIGLEAARLCFLVRDLSMAKADEVAEGGGDKICRCGGRGVSLSNGRKDALEGGEMERWAACLRFRPLWGDIADVSSCWEALRRRRPEETSGWTEARRRGGMKG
jgi:hypothetical protein